MLPTDAPWVGKVYTLLRTVFTMRNTIDITFDGLDLDFLDELVWAARWLSDRDSEKDRVEVNLGTLKAVEGRAFLEGTTIFATDHGVWAVLDATLPRAARRGGVTELSIMLGGIPGGLWDDLVGFAVKHQTSGEWQSDDLVGLEGGTLHVVEDHIFHEHVRVVARRNAVEELTQILAQANSWEVPPGS